MSNAPEGREFSTTLVKTIPVVGQLVAIAGEVVALARASALGTALFAAAAVCGFSLWVIFASAKPKLKLTGLSATLPPVYRYERHWRRIAMLTIFLAVSLPSGVALWNLRSTQTPDRWRPPQIEFYQANAQAEKRQRIESASKLKSGDAIMVLVHALEETSLAVILHDSAGGVSMLPLDSSSGENTQSVTVAAGKRIYLPALSRAWSLTGPAGAETFYVLSSHGAIKQEALSRLLKNISDATTRGVQRVDVPMSPQDFDPLISGVIETFVQECRACALTKFVAFHK